MSYRILTKNAVENTNIDGARDHNFNAGRRSGIVQGALNSGNLFLSANNTIALDTCELRLCGHRVVIDNAEYKTFYNQPSVPIRYSLVAQIIVSNNGESVSFDLKTQLSTIPLVQNDLDKNINGTYELEIGRFTQLTDGTLTDVVRTADLITGGGNNDSEYIRIGTVTTNKISPELDADVDIENTINPDDNKPQTNFTFNLPTSVGTVVSVNGEEKTSINTDITPIASSENLITSGGVHDYPAVAFAESERLKTLNLFNPKNLNRITSLSSIYANVGDNLIQVSSDGNYGNIRVQYLALDLTNYVGKTLYFKCKYSTSSTNDTKVNFWLANSVNDFSTLITTTNTTTGSGDFNLSFVVPSDLSAGKYLLIMFYSSVSVVVKGYVNFTDIMLSTEDIQYIAYNGAIVNEKQIADVEHIETIYDINTKNVLNGVAYTNGITIGTNIVSNEFAGYKKFIIISHRGNTILTTELNIFNNYANVSGSVVLDQSGDYFVIHSFLFNKEYNSFTFSHGGYMYVNDGSSTFTQETADSGNLIVEILGVK